MTMSTLSDARTGRLVFTTPPPGLAPVVDFDLDEVNGVAGLYAMQDAVGADLRLFLIDPVFFVPEYSPVFTEEQLAAVGADELEQVDVYVVATLGEAGAPVVNLLAPILVRAVTHAATQVILDGDWPLRAELVAPEG